MNLITWINVPGALKKYHDWQEDPITQRMLQGLTGMNRNTRLEKPTGEEALQELGFRAGRDADLQILGSLDMFLRPVDGQDKSEASALDYLIHTEGWSPDEAKRIVEQTQEEE